MTPIKPRQLAGMLYRLAQYMQKEHVTGTATMHEGTNGPPFARFTREDVLRAAQAVQEADVEMLSVQATAERLGALLTSPPTWVLEPSIQTALKNLLTKIEASVSVTR